MPAPVPTRVALVALSSAAAIAVAAVLWHLVRTDHRPSTNALIEVTTPEVDPSAAEWQARQAEFDTRHPPRFVETVPGSTLVREWLGEEAAKRLLRPLRDGRLLEHDPYSAFRRLPHQNTKVPFPEHPDGAWMLVTNELGLREDGPFEREGAAKDRPHWWVLATGDSHSEGACNNRESWPNVLEAALGAARPDLVVDVVNASCQGYSPYNHLGVLERFLAFDVEPPKVFVLALYAGNDLYELLHYRHYFNRRQRPRGWGRYLEAVRPLRADHLPALAQVFESTLYFRHNPSEEIEAIEGAAEVLRDIQALCDTRGIRFLPIWLPSAADLEWERHRESFETVVAAVALEPHLRAVGERLRLAVIAQTPGLDWLDATPVLNETPGGAFWILDKHLSLAGHARLAAAVRQRIEQRGWIPPPGAPANPAASAGLDPSGSARDGR